MSEFTFGANPFIRFPEDGVLLVIRKDGVPRKNFVILTNNFTVIEGEILENGYTYVHDIIDVHNMHSYINSLLTWCRDVQFGEYHVDIYNNKLNKEFTYNINSENSHDDNFSNIVDKIISTVMDKLDIPSLYKELTPEEDKELVDFFREHYGVDLDRLISDTIDDEEVK